MKKEQKFTVIVATSNSGAVLRECLNSVFAQSVIAEVIVVDNASTDGTLSIASEFPLKHLITEPDKGVYDAWNKAIRIATGDWIIFLGSDDYFESRFSLESAQRCASNVADSVLVVYGCVLVVNDNGRVETAENDAISDFYPSLSRSMCFTHTGSLHRRNAFEKYGLFDSNFKIAGDYDFMLRALRTDPPVFCPDYKICMRSNGMSNSRKARLLLLDEIIQARKINLANWSFVGDIYIPAKRCVYRIAALLEAWYARRFAVR